MNTIFAKAFLLAICACMIYTTNLVAQTQRSTPLGVGEVAPDFTLVDHHGQKTTLSKSRGDSPVVLVFYRGYW
jgi:cytochrome oxidase Cu insertion factor (SCO1/SenC/PrrC family)